MAVYETLTVGQMARRFADMNRDYYSREGYEYIHARLSDLGAELDVIGVCCGFTEYASDEAADELANGSDSPQDYGANGGDNWRDLADEDPKAIRDALGEYFGGAYVAILPNGSFMVEGG